MEEEVIKKLIKAGKISREAHEFAKKIIKPGKNLLEIEDKIEKLIKERSGNPTWPVNLSVNNQAAHNTANPEELYVLKEDDVLKVDIGVDIEGYIADSSQTIIFSKKHEKLKESSLQALISAKDYLSKNYKSAKISDIGEIIEKKIKSFGFKPISNLTGHFLSRYIVHATPSIPNISNSININLYDQDSNFAIEPFSSTGRGYVNESSSVFIFEYVEDRPLRNKNAKLLLEEIKQFNGLPFSEFWIGKDLSSFDRKIAFRELMKSQAIVGYPILIDEKNSYVSQFETTFIITKDGLIDLVGIDEVI